MIASTAIARVVVVAHASRLSMAATLADEVRAERVAIDDGRLGCEANHLRAWRWHADRPQLSDWAVVLEDDAVPVQGFTEQLARALAATRCPVVSLYLGTGHPVWSQHAVADALERADEQTCWLETDRVLHAVGLAVRTELLPSMLETVEVEVRRRPIDAAIGHWARANGYRVAHALPSLVDHADVPTVICRRADRSRQDQRPRRAWRVGTREHWTSETVDLR